MTCGSDVKPVHNPKPICAVLLSWGCDCFASEARVASAGCLFKAAGDHREALLDVTNNSEGCCAAEGGWGCVVEGAPTFN